jgi:hypothetical protein
MAIKRLHYYDQQFLVESDFTDEQKYHVDMRRRLSRVLHTFGIAEGLEVQRTGNRQVTVKAGTAVDSNGREIVLEADQIVDLSNLTTFPPSTTVFVTIAYQEGQTDPSTATGAPGSTRFTEAPVVQPGTTAPPTDGTVVRLARFDKTAGGDVPGNPNDLLDGGVRGSVSARIAPGAIDEVNLAAALAAKINTPAGIATVDGVSNPGGNVDLVPANAIQVTPNDTTKKITIGETHSARVDNPHATTAAQLGALLASQYEFGHRSSSVVSYNQTDANGAVRTVNLAFQPRMILAVCSVSATLGVRAYGGGSVGFFDALSGGQRNNGFGITRLSDTDWFTRAGIPTGGICGAVFFDSGTVPVQAESLLVTAAATPTGFTTTLSRTIIGNVNALGSFQLALNIFCWGV